MTIDLNKSPLYQYLLENRKDLNLRVKEHPWPKLYKNFQCFDYSVSLSWNGNSATGRGTDENEAVAFLKAGGEALERWGQKDYALQSSSGLAVHTNIQQALENSQNELIERDAFYYHFLSSDPFLITSETQSFSVTYKSLINNLNKLGVELFIVELQSAIRKNRTVLVSAVGYNTLNSFGLVLGLASHLSFEKAAKQAMTECLRNLSPHLFNLEKEDRPSQENKKLNFQRGRINYLCAQQKGYGSFFKKKFLSSFSTLYKRKNISEKLFNSSFYDLRLPFSSKIKLARSQSKVLYKHYYGDLGLADKDFIFNKLNVEKSFVNNLVCSPLA